MEYKTLIVEIKHCIGIVWMNRPKQHNVFDEKMIAELTEAMRTLNDDPSVRAVILAGKGDSFCAGGDLKWMQRMADGSAKQNLADAANFATLLHTIDTLNKPIVARVHGPVLAGGAGLVAACDIAVAAYDAEFCLSEVRLRPVPVDDRALCGQGNGRTGGTALLPFRGALYRRRGLSHRLHQRHRTAERTRLSDQRAAWATDPGRPGRADTLQRVDPRHGRHPPYP